MRRPNSSRPSRFRVAEEAGDVTRVADAKALGNQHLQRLAEQFRARIAEQRLRVAIDESDLAAAVCHEHRVGRRLHHQAKALLGPFTLADVDDRCDGEETCDGLDGVQADLDGNLGAVLVQTEQIAARTHGTRLWSDKEARHVRRMVMPETGGHQQLELLTYQLGTGVAEQRLGIAIDQCDAPIGVRHDDGAGDSLDDEFGPVAARRQLRRTRRRSTRMLRSNCHSPSPGHGSESSNP